MHGWQTTVTKRWRLPRSFATALPMVALAGGLLWAGPPADDPDCEARLERAVEAISTHPRVKGVPRETLKSTTEFAIGNMLFVLLHEMAHGLISDLGLPVLGREEDAADAFATIKILEIKDDFTHRTLVSAAKSWMISDRRSRDSGDNVIYYDAHGLDMQRAYNIVCLMVGSDPDRYDDLANETNMPQDRRETCAGDYSNASWSWNKALEPFVRKPEQVRSTYEIIYSKPEGSLDIFEQAFRATRIMEKVAKHSADQYAWRKPFIIEARTCGEPGANWDVREHKLVLCYELADEFVTLFKAYGDQPLRALSAPASTVRTGAPLSFR